MKLRASVIVVYFLALHLSQSSLRKMSLSFMMSQSAVVVNSCLTPGAARSGCSQASSCQATSPSERRACSSIPPAPAPAVPETRPGAQTQQLVCLQWTRQLAAHVESASPCFQTSRLGKTQSRLGTYLQYLVVALCYGHLRTRSAYACVAHVPSRTPCRLCRCFGLISSVCVCSSQQHSRPTFSANETRAPLPAASEPCSVRCLLRVHALCLLAETLCSSVAAN